MSSQQKTGHVPELLVKKRKRDEQWAAERAAAALESRKQAKTKRKDIFKRAEEYVKEYREQVGKWEWLISCGVPASTHPPRTRHSHQLVPVVAAAACYWMCQG
jgi:hypothetical protein